MGEARSEGQRWVLGRKGKSMLPAICIMFFHQVTLESFKELEPHDWIVSFHILNEAPLLWVQLAERFLAKFEDGVSGCFTSRDIEPAA